MNEENDYLRESEDNDENVSSYHNNFNRHNKNSNNDRVRNQIANRRLNNNFTKSNVNSRVGAVDSSQMQNDNLNSNQQESSQNNSNKLKNQGNGTLNPFSRGNNNDSANGEVKIKIPKKLKMKIYFYLGIGILIIILIIIICAAISDLLNRDPTFENVDDDNFIVDDHEAYKICPSFTVSLHNETGSIVSELSFNDLVISAYNAELLKMSFPLSFFQNNSHGIDINTFYNKDNLGDEIYFDISKKSIFYFIDQVTVDGVVKYNYEQLPINSKVIENEYYYNKDFVKFFAFILKNNLTNQIANIIRKDKSIDSNLSITYADAKYLSSSSFCNIFTAKGRNQTFYGIPSDIESTHMSVDLYDKLHNIVYDIAPIENISYPIQYDTIALLENHETEGYYLVSNKKLSIPYNWLYSNFPQLFDNNGKLLVSSNIDYDESIDNALANYKVSNFSGNQVSLIGSYYLVKEKNYTYDDLLDYFLN